MDTGQDTLGMGVHEAVGLAISRVLGAGCEESDILQGACYMKLAYKHSGPDLGPLPALVTCHVRCWGSLAWAIFSFLNRKAERKGAYHLTLLSFEHLTLGLHTHTAVSAIA